MNIKKKILSIIGIASTVAMAQTTIKTPANWPSQMAFGFPWGAFADQTAVTGANVQNYFPFRFINAQDIGGTISVENSISGANDMLNNMAGMTGASGVAFTMSMFLGQLNESSVSITQKKEKILEKMNDVAKLAEWFDNLNKVATAFSSHKVVAILEPGVWSYILQARFHFADTPCAAAYCNNQATWSGVLDFYVPLREGLAAAGLAAADIAAEVNADAAGVKYPQTVRGLARAMVKAAKMKLNQPTVFTPTSAWAVYASGCSASGKADLELSDANLEKIQSTASVVTWSKSDIELSAMANVRFYRELYGWDWNDGVKVNDYNAGDTWPDGFAIEKHSSDAGMVWDPNGTNHYMAQGDHPGASTQAFFWNQTQMDTWLYWARTVAHGTGLPLLGYAMPLGNGALPNTAFSWQDTFVDWLFGDGTGGTWGANPLPGQAAAPVWNADNWAKFKEAGFIGVFGGRTGWPATGTHWGSRTTPDGATGCNSTINGYTISCGPVSGDGGYFFGKWNVADKSIVPVTVDFDEERFSKFDGFCGATEAVGKTSDVGAFLENKNGGHLKVFAGTAPKLDPATGKVMIDPISGQPVLIDNGAVIPTLPKELYTNNLLIFHDVDTNVLGEEEPIVSTASSQVNGGLAADQIKQYVNNMNTLNTRVQLMIPAMGVLASADSATKVNGMWPLRYEFYLFDHLGQYVSSATGIISEIDLFKYANANSDESLTIDLMLKFIPIGEGGSQIASGVYFLKGYIEEEVKTMCTPTLHGLSQPSPISISAAQLTDPNLCMQQAGPIVETPLVEWAPRVRNAIVINDKKGYSRLRGSYPTPEPPATATP